MDRRPPVSAYASALGMTVAFGMSFVATKYALRGFEPLLLALLRFMLAGGLLWVVLRLTRGRERVSREDLRRLALLGFVSLTLYFTFENLGLARTSASAAAILTATVPIFVALLNVVTLREVTTVRQWTGIALSFFGIILLVLAGSSVQGGGLTGDLLVLGASASAAVYSILARRMLVSRSVLLVTTYQSLFGALFMAPLALAEGLLVGFKLPTLQASGALLYLVLVCSMLAYVMLNYAFRFISANRVAVFINLIPVVGVLGAYVLLGERFTAGQALAAAVVVAGVWLTNSGGAGRSGAVEPGEATGSGDGVPVRSPSAR